jgi:hypothetical protein
MSDALIFPGISDALTLTHIGKRSRYERIRLGATRWAGRYDTTYAKGIMYREHLAPQFPKWLRRCNRCALSPTRNLLRTRG